MLKLKYFYKSVFCAGLLVGLAGGVCLAGDDTPNDKTVGQKVDQNIEAAKKKRKEIVQSMEEDLEKISDEINALRKKSKAETKELIEKLEAQKTKVQGEIRKLKSSSSDKFDRLQAATKKLWSGLKDSVREAKKELEK